ncbi:MAG: type VII toxin-antitoxin system MntA family adenylyltransferase antitoxin [Blastocatellia bacterium]
MATVLDLEKIIEVCRQHDVSWCALFGSMARGEATDSSDVDLLIRFAKPIGLLAHIAIENELADALGRKVDLVTEEALSPRIREHVARDLKTIYSSDANADAIV